jgi:HAMP domain-containing protein
MEHEIFQLAERVRMKKTFSLILMQSPGVCLFEMEVKYQNNTDNLLILKWSSPSEEMRTIVTMPL